MCIGLPMQIRETGFGYALCEGMGVRRQVDTLLIGEQPVGTWVLVFLQSAREVISCEDAKRISQAIQAIDLVMEQDQTLSTDRLPDDSIDNLFADLIDREPPKPPSLLALEAEKREIEKSSGACRKTSAQSPDGKPAAATITRKAAHPKN